jgi:single-stranded-DNA-specific exonuclease
LHPVAKTWRLLPHDPLAIGRLAAELAVAPAVAQLLLNRGVADPAAARRFLDAPLTGLHPPETLPGAARAADVLWEAVRQKQKIVVYGDYDTDGVTGTAILYEALRLLDADADYYVPNRLEEGYGLNCEALRKLAEEGARCVITVDCGVASIEEAREARRLGLTLLVTDHHAAPHAALQYWAECEFHPVHPRLRDGDRDAPFPLAPFADLSGAGVAFKVAWLLCQRACGGDKVTAPLREFLLDAVGLATLGLVADVMPLVEENRTLVRHGLHRLPRAANIGVKALLAAAGLGDGKAVRAEDVAFRLAPRLNAAGRLGLARMVVELLTTREPERAQKLAEYLEDQNKKRQALERDIIRQAKELLERSPWRDAPALVLASDGWHPGVIGIVAGRLADQFARPTLVIAVRGEGSAVGSGRSVPGFALHEALRHCDDHLLSHGGHAAAAGFRILPDRVDAFRERFCEYAARHFPAGPPAPVLTLDAELPLSTLTPGLLAQIDRLEPYGASNPRPRFLAAELQVVGEPRRIGGGERHLTFRVRQGTASLRAIAWGLGDRAEELMAAGGHCCVAFTPRINEWNGYRSIELEVIDFQPGPRARLG